MSESFGDDEYTAPLDLVQLKKKVQEFVDATPDSARLARKCRDYFDNDQISADVREELRKRKQAPIFTNKIAPAVKGLMGILDAGESAPECMPRNSTGQDAADTVTKLLRFITDANKHKKVRKQVSENWLIQGTGAAIFGWDADRGIVTSARIAWEDLIYDPFAKELDFSDARFLGIAKMMDEDQVRTRFPNFKGIGAGSGDLDALVFFDNEKLQWWVSPNRRRCRVVDLYYRDSADEWHRAIFTNDTILFAGPSDYHDEYGLSICPIEAISYEMKRDGFRYGPIAAMLPLQDEVNMRRSRMLHLTSHRQVQQTDLMVPPENKEIARREAAKADGTIPFGWEPVPAPDLAQGQMLLLQKTEADLDRLAPTPAVLGRVASSNESGRARQILQQAGYTELARDFGRFEAWEHSAFTKQWWIAREYMTAEQEIRVTDDPRTPEFIKVNHPVMGVGMVPMTHPVTGQQIMMPQQQVTGMENQIATMSVDIVLTTVPDVATLQQESFQMLSDWCSALKLDPLDPRTFAMIEISTMPDKRGLIDRLKRLKAELDEQSAPQQQMQMQAMVEQHQADVGVKNAKAAKDAAQAQLAQAKTEQAAQEVHIIEGSLWNHPYGQPHPPPQ